MRILVIGGGVFLGAAFVDAAHAAGHALTVFQRGRSRTGWPDGVEPIRGDRTSDLGRLAGESFDAVVDTCGYVPADVRKSVDALGPSCERYLFVSSISVYASFAEAPVREDAPLASAAGIAEDDRDLAHYGAQKAACEREVTRALGERALIVRPGLIVGPRDRSGRFSYWPWRARRGGAMLVPDVPAGEPIQLIDVRDLADWMLRLVEGSASGVFNATGPSPGTRLDWPRLIDACVAGAVARGAPKAEVVRVGEGFLAEAGVAPWTELPVWVPSSDASERAFSRIDCTRAIGAGLVTRPIAETIDAVLDEAPSLVADNRALQGKLTPAREAELIGRWRRRETSSGEGIDSPIGVP